MSVRVRAASAEDLDTLVRLNAGVQSLHARLYPRDFKPVIESDAKPVVEPDTVKAFFAERLTRAGVAILLADRDAVPLGYALWEIQPKPETPFNPARLRAYVHHIAVALEARRRGVATALLDAIEAQAAAKGIFDIALDVWAANLEATQFFAARGFAAFNLSLRKTCPSGAQAMPEP